MRGRVRSSSGGNSSVSKTRSFTVKIDKYLPLYYAGASGDFNLIHIDREFGERQGLGGNILQGMCTMGITANQLIGDDDPAKLKSINVRFASPVYPGDELAIHAEYDGDSESFTVDKLNGDTIISDGIAEWR